ncbi:MAG: hypothetical protein L0271_21805, partial [Gemmatimonadetes bacterium]|nr:hypothetical protein [Gemmatimonadota bacterium]
QGLRAGTRAELAQQLALRWRELNDPTLDSATYVDTFVENYTATAQRRAAIGLAGLAPGNASALDALRDALTAADARGYRPDVVGEVRRVLDTARAALGLTDNGQITITVADPATAAGVAGIQVSAAACATSVGAVSPPVEGACGTYAPPPPVALTQITDPDGVAAFTGLPEGIWEVRPQPGSGAARPPAKLVLLVGSAPSAATSFGIAPVATMTGMPDGSTNTGLTTWTVTFASPTTPAPLPARVQLRLDRPGDPTCFMPDNPMTLSSVDCTTATGSINYQSDDGIVQLDLSNMPGTSEGYWTVTAKVVDAGGTQSDSVMSVTLNDVTPPAAGGIAVPASIAGAAAVTFTAGVDDNVGLGRVERSLAYSGVVFADTASILGSYGVAAGLVQSGTATMPIASFVRSVELTFANGRASATVFGASQIRFRVSDVAGNSTLEASDILSQVLLGAGGSLPSFLTSNPAAFAPANPAHGNFVTQAASPSTLCSSTTGCGPTSSLGTTVTVTMTGPSGTFFNPFSRVEFYWRDPTDDRWARITTAAGPMITDNTVTNTRTLTWSAQWTVTGLLGSTGAQLLGPITFMAVGVASSGSALLSNGTAGTVTLTSS